MLRYRVISGIGLIAFGLAVFWVDSRLDTVTLSGFWRDLFPGRESPTPGLVLLAVAMMVMPMAAWELHRIFRSNQVETTYWLIVTAVLITSVTMYITPMRLDAKAGMSVIASVQVGCFVATLLWLAHRARVEGAVAAAGATMFAVTYLGLLSGFYLAMRRSHSAWVIFAVILVTKSADIGAYAAGKTMGRHKLFPWLSPGKTWEGLVGGVILSMVVAAGFARLSAGDPELTAVYRTVHGDRVKQTTEYDPLRSAAAGGIVALVSVVGGMALSLFKRDAGIKDSGSLFPGMGGVLDVLDTPLMVAPVAYWMLELAARK